MADRKVTWRAVADFAQVRNEARKTEKALDDLDKKEQRSGRGTDPGQQEQNSGRLQKAIDKVSKAYDRRVVSEKKDFIAAQTAAAGQDKMSVATDRSTKSLDKQVEAKRRSSEQNQRVEASSIALERATQRLSAAQNHHSKVMGDSKASADRQAFSLLNLRSRTLDVDKATSRHEQTLKRASVSTASYGNKTDLLKDKIRNMNREAQNNGLARGMIRVENALGSVGKAAASAGGMFSLLKFPVIAAGIGNLIPLVMQLGAGLYSMIGALSPAVGLLGALPGLFLGAATGVGALVSGFKGVGAALKAYGTQQAAVAKKGASTARADAKAAVQNARSIRDAKRNLRDAREAAAQNAKDSADRITAANEQVIQSEDDLKRAQRDVTQAQKDAKAAQLDLTQARKDAKRQLEDNVRSLRDARLAERGASMSLEEAQASLTRTMNDTASTDLDRREATLAVAEAQARLSDSTLAVADAVKAEADASKKGVEGSALVVDAKKQVANANQAIIDAQKGVVTAQKQVVRSQKDQTKAVQDAAKSQRDSAEAVQRAIEGLSDAYATATDATAKAAEAADVFKAAMDKLLPSQRKFVMFLLGLKPMLKDLKKAASDNLLPGVQKGIESMLVLTPMIKRTLGRTSLILGNFIAGIGASLGSVESQGILGRVFGNNERVLKNFTGAGTRLVPVLLRIMDAARPLTLWISELALSWAKAREESSKGAAGMSKMTTFFEHTKEALQVMGRILKGTFTGLVNIGKAGRDAGMLLLNSWAKASEEFARFTGSVEGQNQIKAYFDKAVPVVQELGRLFLAVGGALFKIGASKDLTPLLEQLRTQFLPVIVQLLDNFANSNILEKAVSILSNLGSALAGISGDLSGLSVYMGVLDKFASFIGWVVKNVPGASGILGFLIVKMATFKALNLALSVLGMKNAFKLFFTEILKGGGGAAGVLTRLKTSISGMSTAMKGGLIAAGIYLVVAGLDKLMSIGLKPAQSVEAVTHALKNLNDVKGLDKIFEGTAIGVNNMQEAFDALNPQGVMGKLQKFHQWVNEQWIGPGFVTKLASLAGIKGPLEKLKERFEGVGASLAGMVQSGDVKGAADAFTKLQSEATKAGISAKDFKDLIGPEYQDALNTLKDGTKGAASGVDRLAEAQKKVTTETEKSTKAVDDYYDSLVSAGLKELDAREAARNVAEQRSRAAQALKDNGRTLDNNSEKGRANNQVLDDTAKAYQRSAQAIRDDIIARGGSAEDAAKAYNAEIQRGRDSVTEQAKNFGMKGKELENFATKVGLKLADVPAITLKVKGERDAIAAAKRTADAIIAEQTRANSFINVPAAPGVYQFGKPYAKPAKPAAAPNTEQAGKDVVAGVGKGVKFDLNGIVHGWVQSIKDYFLKGWKDLWDSHSPSKVTATLARDLITGIAQGLLDLTPLGAFATAISTWWNTNISPKFAAFKNYLTTTVGPAVGSWATNVKKFFGDVGTKIGTWWNTSKPTLAGFKDYLTGTVAPNAETALTRVKTAFSGLSTSMSSIWSKNIKPTLAAFGSFMMSDLPTKIGTGVGAIGRSWATIQGLLTTPANFVIDKVLNGGLFAAFNAVAKAVGSDLNLHANPIGGGGATDSSMGTNRGYVKLHEGGEVPGQGNTDTVDAKLTPGEFVLNKKVARRVGKSTLRAINDGDIAGYNRGGLITFGRKLQGMGYQVGENPLFGGVTAGAHTKNSAHYTGDAIDVNHDGAGQAAETAALNKIVGLAKSYGLRTIWQTEGHYNHAHFDDRSGSDIGNFVRGVGSKIAGLVGGAVGALGDPLKFFTDKIASAAKNVPGGEIGKTLAKVPGLLVKAAADKALSLLTSAGSGDMGDVGAGAPGAIGGKKANLALGQKMAAARGWSGSNWSSLAKLWTKESGWNERATNGGGYHPDGGRAFGIPQSLPGKKMASAGSDWRVNPATQIKWGLGYIGGRYQNPNNAWAHSVKNNWYAKGGHVPGQGSTDTVKAMLTPGEFVIRKKAVKKIGLNRLQHLNHADSAGSMQKFHSGGPVMGAPYPSAAGTMKSGSKAPWVSALKQMYYLPNDRTTWDSSLTTAIKRGNPAYSFTPWTNDSRRWSAMRSYMIKAKSPTLGGLSKTLSSAPQAAMLRLWTLYHSSVTKGMPKNRYAAIQKWMNTIALARQRNIKSLESMLRLNKNGVIDSSEQESVNHGLNHLIGRGHSSLMERSWSPLSAVERAGKEQTRSNSLAQEFNKYLDTFASWGLPNMVDKLLELGPTDGMEIARAGYKNRATATAYEATLKTAKDIASTSDADSTKFVAALNSPAGVKPGGPLSPAPASPGPGAAGIRWLAQTLGVPDYAVVQTFKRLITAGRLTSTTSRYPKLTADVKNWDSNAFYANGGGAVPGTGNTDSVDAVLTPGEFVLRKAAAKALGLNNLKAMNSSQFFANGGQVFNPQVPGLSGISNAGTAAATRGIGAAASNVVNITTTINNPVRERGTQSMNKMLRRKAAVGAFGSDANVFEEV